jgi:two-component system, LytTR family, response regulator
MTAVQLDRTFLKKPLNSVYLLMGVVLLVEGLAWTSAYSVKIGILTKHGGFWPYISILFRGLILPEVCTAYILATLLNQHHKRFHLDSVELTPGGIGRYELHLLPTMLLSFLAFNPITETVRFLLEQFPNYSFSYYWSTYLIGTFTWEIYLRYLMPVLLIGYVTSNISLISDYFKQRQAEQETAEARAAEASQAALALSTAFNSKPAPIQSPYLPHLKGRNAYGELDFPVSDVYFFTIEDRSYYAELAKGRYAVTKTLNELETELDPARFFRIKRDYIVNRHAVLNYAYWENGKYIVRLNTPDRYEIVVPRARMQIFREWLQETQQPLLDEAATGSYSVNLISASQR